MGKDSAADDLEKVKAKMSRRTFEVYDVFFLCTNPAGGKVFWHGTTYAEEMWNIGRIVEDLCFRCTRENTNRAVAAAVQGTEIAAESCSGRPIRVLDKVPPVGGRCHSDRGYVFKSLGSFGQQPKMRYVLTPNADKSTPDQQVMWKLKLSKPAVVHLNFRSERHVADTGASKWLSEGGWELSDMDSTITTGIPDELYSGPVYSKPCKCGTVDLMGSNCQEGVYFVFVEVECP